MSFLVATPDMMSAAAGSLVGIGSTLNEATSAAAGSTTSVAAAGADDVSTAISQLFGLYGRQFQALSAQAATFHHEFSKLLNGGAAAYLSTEIANAATAMGAPAAATNPILGSLGPILGGGGGGGVLGGLLGGSPPGGLLGGSPLGSSFSGVGQQFGSFLTAQWDGIEIRLLPALFASGTTISAAGDPWQTLFATTGANLQTIFADWTSDPFPVLRQVISNQNMYANIIGTGLATELQNFPATLANIPANIQIGIQGTSTFAPTMQAFINQQNTYNQETNAGLQQFGADLQKTFPVFEYDMGMAGQSLVTGDYHGAVQDVPRAFLNLFLSGVDIKVIGVDPSNPLLLNAPSYAVEGPAGDLLPLASISAAQQQSLVNLLPPGSIPAQMAQHFVSALNTSTLPLGFAIIGPPIAALDGLATGATVFGAALQTGNGVAAVGALADLPAYTLNGFLNGQTVIDLTIPVTETVTIGAIPPLLPGITVVPANTPIVVHMPFDGILTPPQPISATLEVETGTPLQPQLVTISLGGTEFGGLIPELVNFMPRQVAEAIAP
ncbi:PE family protein [Mycobacterium terramassiliense]|uniref:PE-PGRS family protein n=1 Tax=Mycobacterium terramassiliense TaxID=1841859 RepID=A0A2U3NKX6_9MYCO|nr:PE family protein [Mycobacterium terramassiliense]SPM32150.1 PE-PGRS family protein [Mycobacterium terramassiliense]